MKQSLLFKKPTKENSDLFLKVLSKEHKIDIDLLVVLKKYFGDNLYFLLNILSGSSYRWPNIDNLNELGIMLIIYKEVKKKLNYGIDFNSAIKMTSDKHKITSNKAFLYYNEVLHIV